MKAKPPVPVSTKSGTRPRQMRATTIRYRPRAQSRALTTICSWAIATLRSHISRTDSSAWKRERASVARRNLRDERTSPPRVARQLIALSAIHQCRWSIVPYPPIFCTLARSFLRRITSQKLR